VKRWLILVLMAVGFVIGSKLLIENVLGIPMEALASRWLDRAGVGTATLIVVLLAADVALPIPSSVVMVLSGAAFGVAWGSVVALVGSIAGEWIGFELVRRYGRGVSRGFVGTDEFERFSVFFERHGTLAVMLTRPLPVVMETMSLVAGLSGMSRAAFLGASLAGTAPIVVIYAYAGAMSRAVDSIVPAVVILVAVAGCGYAWYRAKFAASAAAGGAAPDTRAES
jgi:3-dehydroquinate synthase